MCQSERELLNIPNKKYQQQISFVTQIKFLLCRLGCLDDLAGQLPQALQQQSGPKGTNL